MKRIGKLFTLILLFTLETNSLPLNKNDRSVTTMTPTTIRVVLVELNPATIPSSFTPRNPASLSSVSSSSSSSLPVPIYLFWLSNSVTYVPISSMVIHPVPQQPSSLSPPRPSSLRTNGGSSVNYYENSPNSDLVAVGDEDATLTALSTIPYYNGHKEATEDNGSRSSSTTSSMRPTTTSITSTTTLEHPSNLRTLFLTCPSPLPKSTITTSTTTTTIPASANVMVFNPTQLSSAPQLVEMNNRNTLTSSVEKIGEQAENNRAYELVRFSSHSELGRLNPNNDISNNSNIGFELKKFNNNSNKDNKAENMNINLTTEGGISYNTNNEIKSVDTINTTTTTTTETIIEEQGEEGEEEGQVVLINRSEQRVTSTEASSSVTKELATTIAAWSDPTNEIPEPILTDFDSKQEFGVPSPKLWRNPSNVLKSLLNFNSKRKRFPSTSSSFSQSSSASTSSSASGTVLLDSSLSSVISSRSYRSEKSWSPVNVSESLNEDSLRSQANIIFETSPTSLQNIQRAELILDIYQPSRGPSSSAIILYGTYEGVNLTTTGKSAKKKPPPPPPESKIIGSRLLSKETRNSNQKIIFDVTEFIGEIVGNFAKIDYMRLTFTLCRPFSFSFNETTLSNEPSPLNYERILLNLDSPYFIVYYVQE